MNGEINLKLGYIYRKLVNDDFKFLSFMVKNLKRFEYIPLEYIVRRFEYKYSQKEIVARMKKLSQLKVVSRHPVMEAYRLTFLGLDCVALKILVSKNVVKAIGDVVGIGKESEVYKGLSEDGRFVAIKFYKIGKQSFKNIARSRGYYSGNIEQSSWLCRSIIAGLRERSALTILGKYNIPGIPKFYGGALHCIVMEFIEGIRLNEVRQIADPLGVFDQLIEIIKRVYKEANIVHGDLSEYNVMLTLEDGEEKVYIIDWPQYLLANMPMSLQLLKRDIENLAKFFKRRYRLEIDIQEILKYITEE